MGAGMSTAAACTAAPYSERRRRGSFGGAKQPEGKERKEWISPEREIPPEGEEVLVLTQSKKGIRNIDKGYWVIDRFIHRGTARVIGWMSLPEMYPEREK